VAKPDYLKQRVDFADPRTALRFEELAFWMLRFGHLLLQHVPIRRDQRILDIGCGTGFPLFELANLHGPSCRAVGVDIWTAALDRARARLKLHNLPNVEIVEADAAQMPFADAEFDLLVSNLGLNNFEHQEQVLRECFRVAKPGATLALTSNPIGHMREFYQMYREVLEQLGKRDAVDRLHANEAHRGTKESIAHLLETAGFKISRIVEDSCALRYADSSALFHHPLTRLGFLDGWREIAGAADEDEIFTALETRLNSFAAERGELKLTVPMLYVQAGKP
jgi:ubiquinone/menaquinone biosynthesis C-methylase UbiE